MVLWTSLLIEPLSDNFSSIKTVYSSCAKKQETKSSCCKSKCEKPVKKEKKDECENNRCNPLMSCPTGNFYLFGQSYLDEISLPFSKQKNILVNDNRLQKQLTECWHPPEII
jgi:hypothetical protein